MKLLFKEVQKFTQGWLWLLLLSIGLIPIYGIYRQLIQGEVFGDNPMSDSGLIFFAVFLFGVIALFWYMSLTTEIDQKEIRLNFAPFVKRTIEWKNVESAKVVNYGFVGGWGIRLWTQYGTVYNINGNKGLALELKNGKKLLIGTQKSEEMTLVIEKYLQK